MQKTHIPHSAFESLLIAHFLGIFFQPDRWLAGHHMLQTFRSVAAELRSRVRGECFFDEDTRLKFSTAACWYKIIPVGVVAPIDAEDVQSVVRFCNEAGIAVIPRGGGTGLAGQAIGMGIILDFTRLMNRVQSVSDEYVHVQPGVILTDLNNRLRPTGRFFPIDPASEKLCTLGGMIGTNAAGAHGVRYGATKDHVEELSIVLSNGDVVNIGPPGSSQSSSEFYSQILDTIDEPLRSNRDLILQKFPKVEKNSSGYNLRDAIYSEGLDTRKLIIGSEGTLAVVVEAKLKTAKIPTYRMGLLAYFKDYESTLEATLRGLEAHPSAIEILDRTYFLLGSDQRLIQSEAQTMLYYECENDSREALMHDVENLRTILATLHPLHVVELETEAEREQLWQLREEVSETINLTKSKGKTSFIEDVAVPLFQLPAYMRGLQNILNRYNIGFSLYGHAGSGNIHCATFADPTNLDHYRVIDTIASEVNDLAISLGGTLSGEHGDGFIRSPFLERLYGKEVYKLFEVVKDAFDPNHIMNPGKIVGKQHVSILHDLALD